MYTINASNGKLLALSKSKCVPCACACECMYSLLVTSMAQKLCEVASMYMQPQFEFGRISNNLLLTFTQQMGAFMVSLLLPKFNKT